MSEDALARVRRFCLALPETSERLSHGEPTFFVHKKVFVMFANNHHGDGRVAVWLPVPPGAQEELLAAAPDRCFKPPYVGGRGWIGLVLERIEDEELGAYIETACALIAPRRLKITLSPSPSPAPAASPAAPRRG